MKDQHYGYIICFVLGFVAAFSLLKVTGSDINSIREDAEKNGAGYFTYNKEGSKWHWGPRPSHKE